MVDPSPARSLAEELRGWDDERLAALLVARPDLAVPVPPDVGVLAARAGVRLSVLRCLEQLDAFALALLEGLVLLEDGSSATALRRLVGKAATKGQVDAALRRLQDLALVWGPTTALHPVGVVREVVGAAPAGLGRPVAACLARSRERDLAPVCRALGLPEDAGLAGVVGVFEDAARLAEVVEESGAREVLQSLSAGPPFGAVSDAQRPPRPGDDANPVRRAIARGLLVPVDPSTVELPREVALLLRGDRPLGDVRPAPPPLDVQRVDADGAAALAAAEAVARTEALLEAWAAEPAAGLRAGGLGVRELKRAGAVLDVPAETAALLVELVVAAGLADLSPDGEWLPTPGYDTWLARTPEQRWAALAGAWLGLTRLPGLAGTRPGAGDSRDKALAVLAPELERPSAPAERARVLEALAGAAGAPTRDSLLALLRWQAPRRGGRLRDEVVRWTLQEGEVLGVTGRGALSSFGRALLGGDDAARLLGALLPDPLDHVLVQPDLTVIAPGPLERELALELAAVADVESTGGATVYRVSEGSVRRALDLGRSASDLHELFRSRSRTPVPQSLTYLVDDVARRHGRLRVGVATSYLRCDDEALLTEVLAHKRTSSLRLRRLAPTVAVSSAPVDTVLGALREAGYAPAPEAADGALLLRGPESRRTPARSRPARWTEQPLTAEQSLDAVRALRAGDLAARAARRAPVSTTRTPVGDLLAALQEAARDRRQVWIGYVDAQGRSTSRVVEPRSVEGGFVTAHDHLRGEERTFAVHRITGVAELED